MSMFIQSCHLRIKGAPTGDYDDYGNPTFFPPNLVPYPCWFEPRGSFEDTTEREQQIDGYWIYLPIDAPLAAADGVVLMGDDYEVIGEPGVQPGGLLVEGFIKAALERVRG